jgi:integrative and conjugative element protein (TIGR02256 family)
MEYMITRVKTTSLATTEVGGYIIGHKKGCSIDIKKFLHCANQTENMRGQYKILYEQYADELQQLYIDSHGYYSIIGEWHTHPSGNANPSKEDDENVYKKRWFSTYFILGIVTFERNRMITRDSNYNRNGKVMMHLYIYKWKKKHYIGSFDVEELSEQLIMKNE